MLFLDFESNNPLSDRNMICHDKHQVLLQNKSKKSYIFSVFFLGGGAIGYVVKEWHA